MGVRLELKDFDRIGSHVPLLGMSCVHCYVRRISDKHAVNLAPSGEFLMEEFYYAGGLPVVLRELKKAGLLRTNAKTVSGRTIGEDVEAAENYNEKVIRYACCARSGTVSCSVTDIIMSASA